MKLTIKILFPILIIIFAVGCYGTQSAAIDVAPESSNRQTNKEISPTPLPKEEVSPTPPIEKKQDNLTASDLQVLKKWVGKYPIGENRKKENFFEVPEVKPALLSILGKKGYQDFLDGFELVEPIESFKQTDTIGGKQVDFDYLIIKGAYVGKSISNENAPEHTLFVIEINHKEFYILTTKGDKLMERGNVDEFVLPEEIEKKITIYLPEN